MINHTLQTVGVFWTDSLTFHQLGSFSSTVLTWLKSGCSIVAVAMRGACLGVTSRHTALTTSQAPPTLPS